MASAGHQYLTAAVRTHDDLTGEGRIGGDVAVAVRTGDGLNLLLRAAGHHQLAVAMRTRHHLARKRAVWRDRLAAVRTGNRLAGRRVPGGFEWEEIDVKGTG